MRQDVVRCSRGVARHNKPSLEELGEYCHQKVKQINDLGLGRGDASAIRSIITAVFILSAMRDCTGEVLTKVS